MLEFSRFLARGNCRVIIQYANAVEGSLVYKTMQPRTYRGGGRRRREIESNLKASYKKNPLLVLKKYDFMEWVGDPSSCVFAVDYETKRNFIETNFCNVKPVFLDDVESSDMGFVTRRDLDPRLRAHMNQMLSAGDTHKYYMHLIDKMMSGLSKKKNRPPCRAVQMNVKALPLIDLLQVFYIFAALSGLAAAYLIIEKGTDIVRHKRHPDL